MLFSYEYEYGIDAVDVWWSYLRKIGGRIEEVDRDLQILHQTSKNR